MRKIVDQLRNSNQALRDEDLGRVWPLQHERILSDGIYDFAGLPKGVNIAFNTLTHENLRWPCSPLCSRE
jgi:hypothetical protein